VSEQTYIYLIRPRPGFVEDMTATEEETMDRHFAYLQCLRDDGRLVLAGPCLDGAFGVVILRAPSDEDARSLMANDPAVNSGIMRTNLHRFKIALS
jgi:uncharacterized protein YciI